MPPSEEFSIDRLVDLARIEIPDSDRQKVQDELSQVLQFINVIEELDLENVEPFFGMVTNESQQQPQRSDQRQHSIDRKTILKNAPDSDGEFYRVPPVFE